MNTDMKTEPEDDPAAWWWTAHARVLAKNMAIGGVKEFRIFLNGKGNYEFEVVPVATPAKSKRSKSRKS